jgi:hypothetical protein
MNTQDLRFGVEDNEFAWLENIMRVGDGKLKSVPGPTSPVAQFPLSGNLIGGTLTAVAGFSASRIISGVRSVVLAAGSAIAALATLSGNFMKAGTLSANANLAMAGSVAGSANAVLTAGTSINLGVISFLLINNSGDRLLIDGGGGRILI